MHGQTYIKSMGYLYVVQETNVTVENVMYFLTDRYRDSASETISSQAVQKDNCTSFNYETCWTTLEQSTKY